MFKRNLAILTIAGLSCGILAPTASYADSQTKEELPQAYNVKADQDLNDVLKNMSDDYKVKDNADQYKLVKKEKDKLGFTHYTLKPKANGYYAENAEVKIHTDKSGGVIYVNGDLDQGKLEVKNKVKIDKDKAVELAFKSIGKSRDEVKNLSGEDVLGEVKTVVDEGLNRAVYSLEIMYSIPEPAHWTIKVDAENGNIVDKQNVMETAIQIIGSGKGADGKEKTPLHLTQDIDKDGNDIFTLLDTTHMGKIVTKEFDKYANPKDPYNDGVTGKVISNNTNNFDDEKFKAGVDAHYFANEVYDYYKNVHDRDSYDDNGADINSYVNVTEKNGKPMLNAFWNGAEMAYGNPDPKIYNPFSAAKDVVAHELTHAVTGSTAKLVYQGQSGALNESFSDVFGYFVDDDDWTMGEDLFKKPNEALRSLENPKKYGDPDHMRDYYNDRFNEDYGGVHTNSGIPNKAAYNTITRLGKEKAEQIYYRALTKYLTPKAKFSDARNSLIQSAKDLYGQKDADAVKAAWNEVGVK